jgi:hypothetical protein
MPSINHITRLSGETGRNFCLKKAKDCLRIALTTEDPRARLVFQRLAKMWREMADEAGAEIVEPLLGEKAIIIHFPERAKSPPL